MTLIRHPYRNYKDFLSIRRKLQGIGDQHTFRLGASDVAKTYQKGGKIGLDDYSSPTVFFYEACEFHRMKKADTKTLPMIRGQIHETLNYRDYWRFIDPTDQSPETFMENRDNNNVIRTAKNCHQIIINPKYPWLFMSQDYVFPKNKYTPRGPLELKSLSSMESDKYEASVAEKYVIQIHDQMLIGGYQYGELFDVQNQTTPRLFQFEVDKEIQERIIESSHDFWLRVLKGKAIVYSTIPELEKEQMLAELAPDDNGSPLYTDYLKERHKPENAKVTVDGDDEMFQLACDYLILKSEKKVVEGKLLEKENKIREYFRDTNIGTFQFPTGKINWIQNLSVQEKILGNA